MIHTFNTTRLFLSALSLMSFSMINAQNKMKPDTIKFKPTKEVEVTMEVPAQKGYTFYINNTTRNLDIKTWNENKVKIVSTVAVDEDVKTASGVEMFEKAGVTLRSTSTRVELNARNSSNNSFTIVNNGNLVKDGYYFKSEAVTLSPTISGSNTTILPGYQPKRKTMVIYVPEGVKLDIDSRSSDIVLRDNYMEAKLDLTSSTLDGQNIGDLVLIAKYSVVNLGDVNDAQVEFENGTLRAINIKQLDVDSKSSTIEYESGDNIYLRSQRDNYNIESIQKLEGRKQYGELRIDALYKNLNLEGNNADVKIRRIMESVEKIKIDNKYADVRLPVRNLQNYSVAFEGNYSTVFAPFEKTVIADDKKVAKPKTSNTQEPLVVEGHDGKSLVETRMLYDAVLTRPGNNLFASRTGEISPSKFTASVGSPSGKNTKFEVVCHSCTIDFK